MLAAGLGSGLGGMIEDDTKTDSEEETGSGGNGLGREGQDIFGLGDVGRGELGRPGGGSMGGKIVCESTEIEVGLGPEGEVIVGC